MPSSPMARLRSFWWTLHRWIGILLGVLLVPISVSGALLVWHDTLDALVNPGRYAVSSAEVAQPPSAYLASARSALPAGPPAIGVRFPEHDGLPVVVMARTPRSDGAPRFLNVYLDPPSGRVLEVVDFRASLIGFLHRFHEDLTIPEYSGRAIVGWVGVGMLLLSLTGIWLWWPRSGAFLPGLRWRRAPQTSTNLHHLLGFWISIPLAVVSLTGVYLAFPPQARLLMSSLAPMNSQLPRPGFGTVVPDTRLTPDDALAVALAAFPGTRPAVIFLPTAGANRDERAQTPGEPRGGGQREGGTERARVRASEGAGPVWRVQLRKADTDETITAMINDSTSAIARLPEPLAGDRAAFWIRRIHEGSHSGSLWPVIVFLTGVFPVAFAVTGVIMWWRGRRARKALALGEGQLQAAE